MSAAPVEDETFVRRTATLRVMARMLGVGAAAGAILGVIAPLAAAGFDVDAMAWAPIGATVGLAAGTVANLVNACLALGALRRWAVGVVRWVVVPIPAVVATGIAAMSPTAAVVSGVGALAVAVLLAPWCLAPARPAPAS